MKSTASLIIRLSFFSAILIPLCACNDRLDHSAEADIYNEADIPSIDQFWHQFQSELKNRDVSRSTNFPININLAMIEGFEGIENRKEFVRHFDTIFPEPAIRTLLREFPVPESRKMMETMRWSISHNEANDISEREWSIIYRFTRTSAGAIKLTAIDFAG